MILEVRLFQIAFFIIQGIIASMAMDLAKPLPIDSQIHGQRYRHASWPLRTSSPWGQRRGGNLPTLATPLQFTRRPGAEPAHDFTSGGGRVGTPSGLLHVVCAPTTPAHLDLPL